MSAKPVNLNRFRKAKARREKRAKADANAMKFGRSKTERERDGAADRLAARRLDQHRRDDET